MVKTITKIGNSQGLMFDAALMDLAHLKAGDQVSMQPARRRLNCFDARAAQVIAPEKAAATAKR